MEIQAVKWAYLAGSGCLKFGFDVTDSVSQSGYSIYPLQLYATSFRQRISMKHNKSFTLEHNRGYVGTYIFVFLLPLLKDCQKYFQDDQRNNKSTSIE